MITYHGMDANWFKKKQKEAGVTTADIAKIAGRDRSIVSHIYSGRQKMSLEWAEAFAEALNVPVREVLQNSMDSHRVGTNTVTIGFSEGDAAPWSGKPNSPQGWQDIVKGLGGDKAGADVWIVSSDALVLAGYLPGDLILVDTHQSELCRPGDAVIAQVYNGQTGSATTLLRKFQPPVLVAANTNPEDQKVHIVDGENVVIRGKVIASWRLTV